jgi:hypothetical protein
MSAALEDHRRYIAALPTWHGGSGSALLRILKVFSGQSCSRW